MVLARRLSTLRVLYRGESRQIYLTDSNAKSLRGPLRLAIGVEPNVATVEGHYGIVPANNTLDCTLEACMLLKKWPNCEPEYQRTKSITRAQLAAIWLNSDCKRVKKAIDEIIDDL